MCGDFEQGEKLLEKALSFALEIDHRGTLGFVEYVYGCLLARKGRREEAAEHLQKAIKYLEESQTVVFVGLAWAWLGYAHCLMGQSKTAVDLTEKGLKMHTDLGMPFFRSMCHWFCSHAHFETGRHGRSTEHMPNWPCNSRWKTMKDSVKGFRGFGSGGCWPKRTQRKSRPRNSTFCKG